ncbi:hypothetical protein I2494_20240 [Budviciaceae bacterium BWR-B9]|uniref:Uncharacterized protein n=1 Tax=Limnobaculum allomyrinae TaxID=2791986 RepID=A0ABS1IW56_9GAMM|nr:MULTISPECIES: hypothetical protein [Limnobaculum]MBK5146001.1 hypothetical protein [Limnobaculum allomyrinae]MBV7694028.1 hypothetical protein [Limnobaculum sp. M2-1]
MTVWQIFLVLILLFLISIIFSFKKKPSKLRTFMRVLAVLMLIAGISIFFLFKNKMEEVRKCPNNVESFYAKDEVLCFGYENISSLLMSQRQLEMSNFRIINENLVITDTPHNGAFQIIKNEKDSGFSVIPYELK